MRWTSIPSRGGVAILSFASCYRNRVKLRPRGPPWLVCEGLFIYLFTIAATARIEDYQPVWSAKKNDNK